VPSLGDVGWIVQDDEALNLSASEEGNGCNTGLPSENAKPAWESQFMMPDISGYSLECSNLPTT
jgi:hypothetical protein